MKLFDLLQMYEVHGAKKKSMVQRVIAEDIMKNRPLDISEISANYQTRDALRHLGEYTPEVIIKQSDIKYKKDELSRTEEIVRLVGKRCANGHLKKFTIVFDSKDKDANAFRTEMPESLLAIEALTIGGKRWNQNLNCDEFLGAFKDRKLQSIALKNMGNPEHLLKNLNMDALRELSLDNFSCCKDFWTEFFQKGIPTLESLAWDDTNPNRIRYGRATNDQIIENVDIAKAFPALQHLQLNASRLKITTLPNVKRLALHSMEIFELKSLDFVKLLTDSVGSLEELSIVKPQWGCTADSDDVQLLWAKVMRLAANLRKVEFECSPLGARDFISMIEQAPHLTHIHLIASYGISQNDIKQFVKRADLRCLKLQAPVYFSNPTFASLVKYRKSWHDSPIDIFVRKRYIFVAKQTRDDIKNSKYIRLHALDTK